MSNETASTRVTSDLLLVGSLPLEDTESALRIAAEYFGDYICALPDGETNSLRKNWVSYEREGIVRENPDILLVEETTSPTGFPRHAYELPIFAVREEVDVVRWDRWPRIDDAIESYGIFTRLREEGVIRPGLRFQVDLPLPASALNAIKADYGRDYPKAARGFEELVSRELSRLFDAIPAEDLAIQWDAAYETQDIEGVLAWTAGDAWERWEGPITRLSPQIPEEVLLGYHICYGTFPEWPMYEPADMSVPVRMANAAVDGSGRLVDWLHIAGPRYLRSEDDRFYRPLADLRARDTRVFLGIIQPLDGILGAKRRAATASRYLDDFGFAMYCGMGRQRDQEPETTIREHRDTVRALIDGR
ncbi:MAG TPA: hypothetical protein VHV75_11795 [Solirubrobacteraceae bacterium]|jgi:hypothetical protein|nr:hypothetical protein [Solirubrobacteraceae bacterium]